jgi:uncharacterized membrane protein YidH (DUF202 family)
MRWLLLVLLISVVGLLFAALGLARYILQQRAHRGSKPLPDASKAPGNAEGTDVKTEH